MTLRPRYPGLFLVALVASTALWYAVAGQHRAKVSVRSTKANLTLVNLPRSLVLSSAVPDTVTLQLRGPLSLGVDTGLEVFLDLKDARPGRQSYPIDVSRTRLPADVVVVAVDPAEVELSLERLESRTVSVVATINGEPAPGYQMGTVRVSPARMAVEGPESLLAAFNELPTVPVSVEGASGTIQASVDPAAVDPPLRLLNFGPVIVEIQILPVPSTTPTPEPASRRR